MKEFLSIKEFSKLSGIESSTLRYWDDIGLFSPAKRNPENNYRYYSPQQIIAVNFITVLSGLQIPLKTIDEIRNGRRPENVVELIEQQERQLDKEMLKLRERYSIIHVRRDLIKEGMMADAAELTVRELPEMALIIGADTNFKEETFYEPFMRFCRQAESLRINLSYPIGGRHGSMEAFLKAPGQPEQFFSIDPSGNSRRVKAKYLVGYKHGYYGEFGDLPEKMVAYAQEHGLTFSGPVYAYYLLDEICLEDPSKYLSQVCVAVSKAKPKRNFFT